ncbi:MAG: glycosyltransferase [Candidatus Micrarchaeia archaeon]
MPEISIIIPSYNEEAYIGETLESIRRQPFKDYEIIVVDKNSEDNTEKIARKYAKVIKESKPGIALARNVGAKHAKGKILLYIDADTSVSRSTLASYSAAMKDKQIIAATGPIYPREKVSWFVNLGYKVVSVLFVRLSIIFGRPSLVGSNFAIRKDIFEKAGGFNEKFMTYEDWDLSHRIKKFGKISYLSDAVVYTSARRIHEWGITGFFVFHFGNMIRYNILKKPKEEYKPIR